MRRMLVFFSLKPETDSKAYEEWARTVDIPEVNAFDSVASFTVHRCASTVGDKPSPHDYVEILDVSDPGAFDKDLVSDRMKALAKDFAQYAEPPAFVWTEPL